MPHVRLGSLNDYLAEAWAHPAQACLHKAHLPPPLLHPEQPTPCPSLRQNIPHTLEMSNTPTPKVALYVAPLTCPRPPPTPPPHLPSQTHHMCHTHLFRRRLVLNHNLLDQLPLRIQSGQLPCALVSNSHHHHPPNRQQNLRYPKRTRAAHMQMQSRNPPPPHTNTQMPRAPPQASVGI
jgi:hypothetical protein